MEQMRGIFTIPSTPFDERGQLDEEGLRRTVDFCIACGAHGIVSPVNASEFTRLTDEERLRVIRIVTEQTAGRVPVVAGVAGVCREHAVMFSRYAKSVGVDAVIAMPPYINKISAERDLFLYYQGDRPGCPSSRLYPEPFSSCGYGALPLYPRSPCPRD
ncbi:MAG: dihydrodipicolinate synthase family protein [Anaerolineae bacterium]|nr:dihydrodipicolinate synthase family protein [Anaerolineae bacterium]